MVIIAYYTILFSYSFQLFGGPIVIKCVVLTHVYYFIPICRTLV